MRNRTILFTFLVLFGLLLVACGAADEPADVQAPAAAAPTATAEPVVKQEAEVEATEEVVEEVAEPTTTPTEEVVEEAMEEEAAEEEVASDDANVEVEATVDVEVEEAMSEEAEPEEVASAGPQTFQIVQEQSEARFYIDEVLFGNDVTVEGITSLVTGEIQIDPANPAGTTISPIQIDARDLTTDENRRNNAIRRRVLLSEQDQYQFITFTPITIDGLPETVAVGDAFEFTVTGDLTIVDTTKSETFTMNVTVNSESEITGLGTTTVLYPDYGISIPEVPIVASVEDEVRLEIEFVAVAQ